MCVLSERVCTYVLYYFSSKITKKERINILDIHETFSKILIGRFKKTYPYSVSLR